MVKRVLTIIVINILMIAIIFFINVLGLIPWVTEVFNY